MLRKCKSQAISREWCVGAPDRNRTRDLRFTKPLLYQLSYKGKLFTSRAF